MTTLVDELRIARKAMSQEEWIKEATPACRNHPLHALLLQDPYTRRAFEKPRGYAGDAEMIDFIYFGTPPEGTTPLGREVFRATARGPNALSVVERRDLFAEAIDATSRRTKTPAILSVGCGHLREGQVARSVHAGWAGTLYALDQDALSLAVVEQEQALHGVRTICCQIGPLLRGQPRLTNLDLIYASGLFDYLPDSLAARLTRSLFGMLGPGGRVVIANFVPDNHGRGYMEAFMDWQLLYRDEAGLEALADTLPRDQVAERRVYRDVHRNIVFLELARSESTIRVGQAVGLGHQGETYEQ